MTNNSNDPMFANDLEGRMRRLDEVSNLLNQAKYLASNVFSPWEAADMCEVWRRISQEAQGEIVGELVHSSEWTWTAIGRPFHMTGPDAEHKFGEL